MPKKYTRRYRKKRPYGKRRRRRRAYVGSSPTVNALSTSPFPTRYKVNMRYVDNININPGATLTSEYVYCVNGIYDPDITGVGHQPTGFDQLMPFYDHYVVIGSVMTATFSTRNTAVKTIAGVTVKDSLSGITDYREMVEQGNTKYAVLGIGDSSKGIRTFRYPVNPSKFLGRSKPLSDDQLKGSSSANPTELCYYHLWVTSLDGGDPTPVDVQVKIDYTVIFIEPKTVGLS